MARDFPKIHFYNQDFVDLYDKTWAWVQDGWVNGAGLSNKVFGWPLCKVLDQAEAIYSSFFLVYSNRIYHAYNGLDALYAKQEDSGAIRWKYNAESGEPVFTEENPEGLGMPLFAWAEFNLYHRGGNKKRMKEVIEKIKKYILWIDSVFRRENGLYQTPVACTGMWNAPRENASYLVDFNCAMAVNALYAGKMANLLNDKDTEFYFKQRYFALKTRINKYMWDEEAGFYCDIDEVEKKLPCKTIAGYWPLLAEIPNDEKSDRMIEKLTDTQLFGTPHPFPTVAANEEAFQSEGMAYRGSVFPHLTFMVIKGLEQYHRHELARDSAIRHLYFVLDSLVQVGSDGKDKNVLWEAYHPLHEGPPVWPEDAPVNTQPIPGSRSAKAARESQTGPRQQYLPYAALSTIALMMENVVGLQLNLPDKCVEWTVPSLEIMGIENLSLKKNIVTILASKSGRGWEIHLESEKLYYFSINVIGKKSKRLPIPSGKCSMLIDKI